MYVITVRYDYDSHQRVRGKLFKSIHHYPFAPFKKLLDTINLRQIYTNVIRTFDINLWGYFQGRYRNKNNNLFSYVSPSNLAII